MENIIKAKSESKYFELYVSTAIAHGLDEKFAKEISQEITQTSQQNYTNASHIKGQIDQVILFKLYHDKIIHNKYIKEYSLRDNEFFKEVFDYCEKIRLLLLGTQTMLGMRHNIQVTLVEQMNKIIQSNEFLGNKALLELFTLFARLLNNKQTYNKYAYANQDKFAQEIIAKLALQQEKTKGKSNSQEKTNEQNNKNEQNEEGQKQQEEATIESQESLYNLNKSIIDIEDINNNSNVCEKNLVINSSADYTQDASTKLHYQDKKYKIFTKEYDEIVHATDLISEQDKINLSKQLANKSDKYLSIIRPLVKKLERKLLSYTQLNWQNNNEHGTLDSKQLCRVIADPLFSDFYKTVNFRQDKKSLVTLLIDNSGSMRGYPIEMAMICSKIIAQILEKSGVHCEILGFTTKAWKGGRAYLQWLKAKQPSNPGRLNELRHIIYKDYNKSFKKSQNSLSLMLKDGILKENIDGESLLWAYKRSQHNGLFKKKILIVISDGAPVDDATTQSNNKDYLEDHLKSVINLIEKQRKVILSAIGIGHDVTKLYKNSIMIKNVDLLAETLINQLTEIFE